jgi:hypothetical protein
MAFVWFSLFWISTSILDVEIESFFQHRSKSGISLTVVVNHAILLKEFGWNYILSLFLIQMNNPIKYKGSNGKFNFFSDPAEMIKFLSRIY